jgi:DNA-binding IclR family transcriptional regulator
VKPDYTVKSLQRASEILSCFKLSEPVKSLKQLSEETGLHKSTVFRMLETLEMIGWVRKDLKTGLYRLGFGIFELGVKAVNGLDFYKESLPHLEELVKDTEQSAHLVINDSGEAFYLNKVESPGSIITQPSQIGLRFPMHCTAVGKVLLSFMDEKVVNEIIDSKGLRKITDNTLSTRKALFEELKKIREEGYAVDNEEIQPGLRCVAAPLRDYSGKVVAAISVSGMISNMSEKRLPHIIDKVIGTAAKISSDLGCRGYL